MFFLFFLISTLFKSDAIQANSPFTFKKISENDISLLAGWFEKPHVQEWWPVPAKEESFDHFLKRIRSKDTFAFLVIFNGMPIGYIQYYYIDKQQDKAGKWLPELPQNTVGLDQFIGDPTYLGKGLGTRFIKEFINFIKHIEPHISTFIVDPDPENHAAIRCYEKVGFSKTGIHQSSWGPVLLMIYNIQE